MRSSLRREATGAGALHTALTLAKELVVDYLAHKEVEAAAEGRRVEVRGHDRVDVHVLTYGAKVK